MPRSNAKPSKSPGEIRANRPNFRDNLPFSICNVKRKYDRYYNDYPDIDDDRLAENWYKLFELLVENHEQFDVDAEDLYYIKYALKWVHRIIKDERKLDWYLIQGWKSTRKWAEPVDWCKLEKGHRLIREYDEAHEITVVKKKPKASPQKPVRDPKRTSQICSIAMDSEDNSDDNQNCVVDKDCGESTVTDTTDIVEPDIVELVELE